MVKNETKNGMRVEKFLATDLMSPFENRKASMMEMEKEVIRKKMLDIMYNTKKLLD